MDEFKRIKLDNENESAAEGADMQEHPSFTAVVLAAGSGLRMRSDIKKQFMLLGDVPIVIHSLRAFDLNKNISSTVLVTAEEDLEYAASLCAQYGIKKVREIAEGGDTRFRSVYNGIRSAAAGTDYILIHDGARPLLSQGLIDRCCDFVTGYKACVPAVPVTDTIKVGDKNGYLGYQYKHSIRYDFTYGDKVRFGVLGAQDAGEPFLAGKNSMGYDFYSFLLH